MHYNFNNASYAWRYYFNNFQNVFSACCVSICIKPVYFHLNLRNVMNCARKGTHSTPLDVDDGCEECETDVAVTQQVNTCSFVISTFVAVQPHSNDIVLHFGLVCCLGVHEGQDNVPNRLSVHLFEIQSERYQYTGSSRELLLQRGNSESPWIENILVNRALVSVQELSSSNMPTV